mgnify:CR=1 FL=1
MVHHNFKKRFFTISNSLLESFVLLATWLPFSVGVAAEALAAQPGEASPPGSEAEVLLHLLQQKGLISAQEAEQVRAEAARRATQTAEEFARQSRLHFNRWIERVDLYGDARLRFEHRGGEDGAGAGDDHLERNRWRYRLRLGTRWEFSDHLRAGLRVETGSGGRSSNVTFGDDAGPSGKESDRLFLGLLYLNWTPYEWLSVTAGRQENPLQTTSLVWDPDLTPEGLSETFRHKIGRFDLFATFGQFVYDDANPDNPFGSVSRSDAFLFVNQLGARFNVSPNLSLQVAPALHVYSGEGDSHRGPFVGTAANSAGINDLLVLEVPAEVKFKLGTLPVRIFGDFGANLHGDDRARAAGVPQFDTEVYAWQAGAELGSVKQKEGWSFRAFYQASDLFALDPNLVDSDLFDSRLNLQGFAVQGVYALTDFAQLTLSYAHADRNNKALPTGAVGDLGGKSGTAFLENYQLFQVDLNFKF